MTVISTVVTERMSSAGMEIDKNEKDWRNSVPIPDDYASYHDKCLDMLEPLWCTWDGHLGLIPTVKHHVDL